MVNGIYLHDVFEITKGTYELYYMKIEHINSAKDFIVGLSFRNITNFKDTFTETASTFLAQPHKKINSILK